LLLLWNRFCFQLHPILYTKYLITFLPSFPLNLDAEVITQTWISQTQLLILQYICSYPILNISVCCVDIHTVTKTKNLSEKYFLDVSLFTSLFLVNNNHVMILSNFPLIVRTISISSQVEYYSHLQSPILINCLPVCY
jgi:hypothetical protein